MSLDQLSKRVEIGGGLKPQPGYLQMDVKKYPWVDIVGNVFHMPFDNELEEIYGHWVLEHFAYRDIPDLLKDWHRALKSGGFVHMVTNNGESHLKAYQTGEINIHELNRMIFGLHLEREKEGEIPTPGQQLADFFWMAFTFGQTIQSGLRLSVKFFYFRSDSNFSL